MRPISHIWHLDKVLWELEGCHLQDRTTALAHRTPTHPHLRALSHSHHSAVPRHLLGHLPMQRLRFTIAQEDRLLQRILLRLLHSTLRLQDTLLQVHDIHRPPLHFHQHLLGTVLSRLRSAQHLHVILRRVHPLVPLLLDVCPLYSGLLYSLTDFLSPRLSQ